jgi:hypothetical protein
MAPRARSVFAVLLASSLAACGGGSSTPLLQSPDSRFAGPYAFVGIAGEQNGAETITASWGEAEADGQGAVTLEWHSNVLGVIVDGLPEEVPYSISSDRVLEVVPILHGIAAYRGGITEEGDVAAMSTSLGGLQPGLVVFGRKEGAYDLTSLTGTYRFARYGGVVLGPSNVAGWGTVTFDGLGGGTATTSSNQEGFVFGPAAPAITYQVGVDGAMRLDLGGGVIVEGQISANGDLLLLSGGTVADANPATYVLVRQGAGMSDEDFDGQYFVVALLHDPATNSYASFTGVFLADGAGNGDMLGLLDSDGDVSLPPGETSTTSVAADGTVTLTTLGGDTLVGGISPDGRFAALAGTTNPGGGPSFVFLLR